MTDAITSKLATLALTLLVSSTLLLGAVGPATALGTTPTSQTPAHQTDRAIA